MPLGEETRLDPTGSNLAKFLNSILGKDPDEFVLLKNKVAETLPIIDRILAPPRGGEATVDIIEKGLRRPIDLGNVSLGFMQTLILIIGIATEDERNLIMIEEPELHLHADAQRRLFEFIQRQSERNQFFLTTHSTVFTGCSDKICTYLTTKKHGKTSVKKVKETVELRVLKGLLGYRNTDFYGDECVVFIEGDSEEIALPIIADALELGLVERGIRLVNVRGGKRAAKIKEYLNYLKNSGVMSYVIADGDKTVRSKLEDWQKEGVVENNCWTVWDLEFEDCFSLDMVVAAFNELMKDQEAQLKVNANHLKKEMKQGESVVRVLERILHQNNLPNLDKPSLAEKLAYLLSEDIKKDEHEETVVEKELKKIAELVESRGKVTS